MGCPAVETKNLTKRYHDFVALDALSIQIQPGQILGFIGPNGAGKTTTINILVGLSKPTSGTAFIDGVDCVADAKRIKQLVGFMPDTFGVYDNMRVREYLDFFGAAFKIPRKHRQKRIDQCMDITGSAYMKDRYVQALSHGMKQRVAIARTLLHDPKVLILDEPANGLDPQARIDMRNMLLQLAQMGKTLIVTSHILPELSRICDTVAIVSHGQLRAFGTLDQITRNIRQHRLMEVHLLDASHMALAQAYLKDKLGPTSQVTTSPAESIVRLTTDQTDADLAALLTGIIQQGAQVLQFREMELDLEDAFLSVTASEGGSGDRPAL